jgi:hypothetical protein
VGSSLIAIGLGLAVVLGEVFGINLFWSIERSWKPTKTLESFIIKCYKVLQFWQRNLVSTNDPIGESIFQKSFIISFIK